MEVISENEFNKRIREVLEPVQEANCVTGPGRSGSIAAVYASHILGIPYLPFGSVVPDHLSPVLLIDTAMESGATMRKAQRQYAYASPISIVCYHEPPRVMFWYEAGKPQRYRHEIRRVA